MRTSFLESKIETYLKSTVIPLGDVDFLTLKIKRINGAHFTRKQKPFRPLPY
ncbi:MAG: hypothetical protein RIQ90_1252 [Bacteroidota bacterium]|jgi:hypothetical protein